MGIIKKILLILANGLVNYFSFFLWTNIFDVSQLGYWYFAVCAAVVFMYVTFNILKFDVRKAKS